VKVLKKLSNVRCICKVYWTGLASLLGRAKRATLYFLVWPLFALGVVVFYSLACIRSIHLAPKERRIATRHTIHEGARLLFRGLEALQLVRIEDENQSQGDTQGQSRIVVANHPSMLDAMFFLSRYPQLVCVMKPALLRVPIIGGLAQRAGYLPHHDAPDVLQRAKDALSEGAALLIFPEGTRSPASRLGEFKRGAARLAMELRADLTPYALFMAPVVLSRERPWWRPPREVVVLRVKQLNTLTTRGSEPWAAVACSQEDLRRESVRLTESLELLVDSWLSSMVDETGETGV
jgi:1-acyl-sn-glycerol-3-phosphate acyltransferase